MARNKYPEQTIERILDVAEHLFWEKGYDHTSVQDILDELKDLSKGAIYHHFKSKEDLFDAVAKRRGDYNQKLFLQIQNDITKTGAEKLKTIFESAICSEATKVILKSAPSLIENPKFLAIQFKQMFDITIPQVIQPVIEQGVKDGSIQTDKPQELAQVITLLINIWLNPLIWGESTKEQLEKKCALVQELLAPYQITLLDQEMIEKLFEF